MSPNLLFIVLLFVGTSVAIGVPINKLFPFGSETNDSFLNSNTSLASDCVFLPLEFPYFDELYRNVCITTNGLFTFGLHSIVWSRPANLSTLSRSVLLAAFWSDPTANQSNEVFYQVYSSNDQPNITERISRSVKAFFPDERTFQPKSAIIVTWNRTNFTIQTVLSTDSDRSFVFLLYHNLQNYIHINGTAYPRVGFVGNRAEFARELKHSGTKDIGLLIDESNVNGAGLFVFRIDSARIDDGGCHQDASIVSLRPRMGSFFGSNAVIITGPCFTNQTVIQCHFGSSTNVKGLFINQYRAMCLSPWATTHGPISVNVSIDNGQKTISESVFTYAPMRFGSDEVEIQLNSRNSLIEVGQSVTLKWTFPESIRSLFPNDTTVDIEFWSVTFNSQSGLKKNNQSYSLVRNHNLQSPYQFKWPSNMGQESTGFIRVVARSNGNVYAGLNTGLLTLYTSASAAMQSCQTWAKQQNDASTWNQGGLLQCPMNRWQAIAGGFCCYRPDHHCQKDDSNPNNCWLHRGRAERSEESAVECYQSIRSNSAEAGSECCYDRNDSLITRGQGSGTDNRYHPILQPVKHFFDDILPYIQCCIISNDSDTCDTYLTHRPPRSGSNTMGDTGRMWGDPHLGTLDGTSYTFNGYGEYIYLAISNKNVASVKFNSSDSSLIFTSQIRTEPIASSKATVTTGFAARSTEGRPSEKVSLTISSTQQIVIKRGEETLEFENTYNQFIFPEMTINQVVRNQAKHFILTWSIGVSFDIKVVNLANQIFFDIAASVSKQHRQRTYGLLGFYNGEPDDDLQNSSGKAIPRNASEEDIFHQFGKTWAIEPSASLFFYERGRNADYFKQQSSNFQPKFFNESNASINRNITIANACKINSNVSVSKWTIAQRSCYYDYSITGNEQFAKESLSTGQIFTKAREEQQDVPLFSEKLPLQKKLVLGEEVKLNFSVAMEKRSNSVVLNALHLPQNGIFNNTNGLFIWKAIEGKHYVSIQAKDLVSSKTNKHEVFFDVKSDGVSGFSTRQSMTMASSLLIIALHSFFA